MITREITTFEVQAFGKGAIETLPDGRKVQGIEPITPAVVAMDTSLTKTEARKALLAAGHTVPKGSTIEVTEVAKVKYACTVEDFIKISSVIEEVEL